MKHKDKLRDEAPDVPMSTAKLQAMVDACSPTPEPAIRRSLPVRLIDIDIHWYRPIRQQSWPNGDVRDITLDEARATQLMHDLARALLPVR